MKARLRDLMRGVGGGWIVSFFTESDPRELFDQLKDVDVSVDLKKWSKHRSLDANAFAWVLIDQIAERMNMTKTFVYRAAIRDIGGVSTDICVETKNAENLKRYWESKGLGWQAEPFESQLPGCTNFTLYCGSSVFNTAQMSQLISILIQEAEGQGIPTITPKEAEEMLKKWGRKVGESKESAAA